MRILYTGYRVVYVNKVVEDVMAILLIVLIISAMGIISSIAFYDTITLAPRVRQGHERVVLSGMPRNIIVTGGGSTFINPQMQAWIQKFVELYSSYGIIINYQPIGSGAGVAKLMDGALDFAITDVPLPRDTYLKLRNSSIPFIQIPIVVGAVAIVYNIPEWNKSGCGALRVSGDILADIYLGKIVYWNDPRIIDLQRVECRSVLMKVDRPIIAVHRADGSGTTALFTAFLSKISDEWRSKIGYGYTVVWPRDAIGYGVGGRGSENVAAIIKSTPYSIGYIEYGYALTLGMNIAMVRNKDGIYVEPNITTVKSALNLTGEEIPKPTGDWEGFMLNIIFREGKLSYPIVGLPIAVIRTDISPPTLYVVKKFMEWILTDGQNSSNLIEGYLPLPDILKDRMLTYLLSEGI